MITFYIGEFLIFMFELYLILSKRNKEKNSVSMGNTRGKRGTSFKIFAIKAVFLLARGINVLSKCGRQKDQAMLSFDRGYVFIRRSGSLIKIQISPMYTLLGSVISKGQIETFFRVGGGDGLQTE